MAAATRGAAVHAIVEQHDQRIIAVNAGIARINSLITQIEEVPTNSRP